jgi:predicted nicotinamide N-methyase
MNADVLKAMLEHPSASRLNKDGSVAPVGERSDLQMEEEGLEDRDIDRIVPEEQDLQQTMISKVAFDEFSSFSVQEIGFVKHKLGADETDLETTGGFLWAASIILSHWLVHLRHEFEGKRVVELGAGCALPSLAAAFCTNASTVLATDMDSATFNNTVENIKLNSGDTVESDRLSVVALNWRHHSSWPLSLVGKTDIIIGSDLVFDYELVEPLVETILRILPDVGTGVFYYVTADSNRAGCAEFLLRLEKVGFVKEKLFAPQEFYTDPFIHDSKDEESSDLFSMRFPEFSDTSFTMYRFSLSR